MARCGYIGYSLFVCTVTDFFGEDKANGVKFCTVVYRRPGQGISHVGELCSPRSPKSDESASERGTPEHAQPYVNINVDMRRLKIHARDAPFVQYRAACGRRSACVDRGQSPLTYLFVCVCVCVCTVTDFSAENKAS